MALNKYFTAYCCKWTYMHFNMENVQNERKCCTKIDNANYKYLR